MGRFFLALRDRRMPALVAGTFDWVDVRDVAEALIAAENRGRIGESYLVPGHRCSVGELAAMAEGATGVRAPRVTVPMPLAEAWARLTFRWQGQRDRLLFTPESMHALRADPRVSAEKARTELGHRPRPTTETIADLYEWFGAARPIADHG